MVANGAQCSFSKWMSDFTQQLFLNKLFSVCEFSVVCIFLRENIASLRFNYCTGHYVPQLSQAIVKYNQKNGEEIINLKGFMVCAFSDWCLGDYLLLSKQLTVQHACKQVGNALTDDYHDYLGRFQFWWSVGLISDQTYRQLNAQCDTESFIHVPEQCEKILDIADEEIGDIDMYSIYTPPCTANFSRLNHLWRRKSVRFYIFGFYLGKIVFLIP